MSELTPAASLAWRLAAAEAAGARHELIECGHFLIGILSVEKVVHGFPPGVDLPAESLPAARGENERIAALLASASMQATELRRALRDALGAGAYDHAGRPMSRSPALRAAFRRAAQRAAGSSIDCLHFLAALAEEPDPPVARALARVRCSAAELLKRTPAALGGGVPPGAGAGPADSVLEALTRRVQETHGITLRITTEAAGFLAERAAFASKGPAERLRAAESLVQAPLESLARLGKLSKSSAWQLVYEEGGLYLLPD